MTSTKKKLLAVEDSQDYQLILKSTLQQDYDVTIAGTAHEAYEDLKNHTYDLILLDIILPDSDGYEICSQIRSNPSTSHLPIIFVTSKETIPEKVMGFSLGADDYITKPFNTLELKARVASKLRLSDHNAQNASLVKGCVEINTPTQRVYLCSENEKEHVDLTTTEFRLLSYMAHHEDHVLGRDQILEAVWGETLNVTERTVDTHVSKLRKKLKNAGEYIKSVHGSGYRFSSVSAEQKKVA